MYQLKNIIDITGLDLSHHLKKFKLLSAKVKVTDAKNRNFYEKIVNFTAKSVASPREKLVHLIETEQVSPKSHIIGVDACTFLFSI